MISGVDPGFPVGGAPTLVGGGANLQHRHFSVKTYVKTKEFGPVGGGARRKLLYVDPPLDMHAHTGKVKYQNNIICTLLHWKESKRGQASMSGIDFGEGGFPQNIGDGPIFVNDRGPCGPTFIRIITTSLASLHLPYLYHYKFS